MKTECQSYYCPPCLGILSAYRFDEITKWEPTQSWTILPRSGQGTPYSAVGIHPQHFYYLKQVAGHPSSKTQTQNFPGPPQPVSSPLISPPPCQWPLKAEQLFTAARLAAPPALRGPLCPDTWSWRCCPLAMGGEPGGGKQFRQVAGGTLAMLCHYPP